MRLLLLTQVLPYPPDSGPKDKTLNTLKYLSANFEVTLVSFVRGDQSEHVDYLRKYCKEIYTVPMKRNFVLDGISLGASVLKDQAWMMVRDHRRAMYELITNLDRQNHFELVYADQLNMAQYAQNLNGARKILDEHNALWLLYQRLWKTMPPGPKKWILARDWRLLKRYEGKICDEFDVVLAVSDEDRQALQEAIGHDAPIKVIPITVDIDELKPVKRKPVGNHILYVGTLFWPPNVDGILWFIREVFPLIRQRMPDVQFDIIGARPPREIINYSSAENHINVTGYVKDLTPYLQQSRLMVVPLRAGGGMRVKILNNLAQAIPVVTTSIGCEGIAVEHGKHLLIADSPQDFAEAVIALMESPQKAQELGENGRNLILERYDFRVAFSNLADILQKG